MRETKTLNMIRIVKLWQDNKAPKVYKEASNKLTKEDTQKDPQKIFPQQKWFLSNVLKV